MSTYTGTCIKDLVTTTPTENSTPPSELNDAIREIKTVYKNNNAVIVRTADLTLDADDHIVLCNCTSGAIAITLPAAATVASSTFVKRYTITKTDSSANAVTITGTVNGVSNPTLTSQYESMTLICDGTNWYTEAFYATGMSKVGTLTRDLTAAAGDVATTGVGFKPSAIIFLSNLGLRSSIAVGVDDGTTHYELHEYSDILNAQTTFSILAAVDGDNKQEAVVKTMDADGFTLTWTKSGSPTGTATIGYIAFR